MSKFTLTISCLPMSNLPWFMDLTFLVHIFTALHFTFPTRLIHSWLSFLLWPSHFILSGAVTNCPCSPVAYWTPSDLGGSSSGGISFCLFLLFMGFSKQEYCSDLPLPLPVDHVLSELFTMTLPSWVALHSMNYSFTELCKPLPHDNTVIHDRDLSN